MRLTMSDITTLVEDMYNVLNPATHAGLSDEVLKNFGERAAHHVKDSFESRENRTRESNVLYASEAGERCSRKLYYRINNYQEEPIPPHTYYKFLYGDVVEETTLLLAEAAGHSVSGCQEKVVAVFDNGWEVRGRMDAVIDGVPIDVKSMTPAGFAALPSNLDDYDDKFGYVDQVSFYRNWGRSSEQVGILAVDKTLGHIKLSLGTGKHADQQRAKIKVHIDAIERGTPDRAYKAEPEGKSGNMKLGVACSYCPFKKECWPGVRTFIYSRGPVYLTEIKKVPNVPEILDA